MYIVNKKMSQINTRIDDDVLDGFREVIFHKYGLKKGDFKKALEEALQDYIQKHNETIAKSN